MRKKGQRPQRRRVFVGCEGQCEKSYSAFISDELETQRQDRYLDAVSMNGSDPLSIVEKSIECIKRAEKAYGSYFLKMVLLDSDKLGACEERDVQIVVLAKSHGLLLVWQSPCFEGLLFSHFDEKHPRPATSKAAILELRKHWGTYKKPPSRYDLARHIGRIEIERARRVEPDLDGFFTDIGFA
jgi:hypothetical protein